MRKLRMVGLRRVSTKDQEDGASLEVQTNACEAATARLPEKWEFGEWYGGVESGADGLKPEFNRMLADAKRRKFDGVMCMDHTRFSRSTKDSIAALAILEEAGVRLFMLETEMRLDEPDDMLQMDLHMAIGQHFARKQKRKSIDSRVLRAQQGLPSAGRPPYGRVFNKLASPPWSIDPEAKRFIEKVIKLYLKGKTWGEIAAQLPGKVDENTVRRRVQAAGPDYTQKFTIKGKVTEIVTKIPALASEEDLKAVAARSRHNQLSTARKRVSPLAHLVRCGHCSSVLSAHALSGTTWEYYRHHMKTRKPGCVVAIRADKLEEEVFAQMWTLFRDPKKDKYKALRKSIGEALNEAHNNRAELESERADRVAKLAGIEREQDNVVQSVAKSGPAMAAKLNEKFEKLEATKGLLQTRISEIDATLPTLEVPSDLAERVDALLGRFTKYGGPMHWTPEQQEELATIMIGGRIHWRRPEDKGRGIFVKQLEGGGWTYELKGSLILASGTVGDVSVEDDHNNRSGPDGSGEIPGHALANIARELTYTVQHKAKRLSA